MSNWWEDQNKEKEDWRGWLKKDFPDCYCTWNLRAFSLSPCLTLNWHLNQKVCFNFSKKLCRNCFNFQTISLSFSLFIPIYLYLFIVIYFLLSVSFSLSLSFSLFPFPYLFLSLCFLLPISFFLSVSFSLSLSLILFPILLFSFSLCLAPSISFHYQYFKSLLITPPPLRYLNITPKPFLGTRNLVLTRVNLTTHIKWSRFWLHD